MRTRLNRLIEQIHTAQKTAKEIIDLSGLKADNLVYCFATSTVLVINCSDYPTICRFEEGYIDLRKAIAQLGYSIEEIWLELNGKVYYEF